MKVMELLEGGTGQVEWKGGEIGVGEYDVPGSALYILRLSSNKTQPSFLKRQMLQTDGFCFEGFRILGGRGVTGFEFSPVLIYLIFSTLNISQAASIIYKHPFEKGTSET